MEFNTSTENPSYQPNFEYCCRCSTSDFVLKLQIKYLVKKIQPLVGLLIFILSEPVSVERNSCNSRTPWRSGCKTSVWNLFKLIRLSYAFRGRMLPKWSIVGQSVAQKDHVPKKLDSEQIMVFVTQIEVDAGQYCSEESPPTACRPGILESLRLAPLRYCPTLTVIQKKKKKTKKRIWFLKSWVRYAHVFCGGQGGKCGYW